MTEDEARQHLFTLCQEGNYLDYVKLEHRPAWMSDEQWRQAVAYIKGEAVPFDSEVLDGLQSYEGRVYSRAQAWVYSHVPSVMAYSSGFAKWCELIEGTIDPDLKVDEGL